MYRDLSKLRDPPCLPVYRTAGNPGQMFESDFGPESSLRAQIVVATNIILPHPTL
jgi:hypothetical protein